jgi:IclR helix-turn-helix domain
MLGLSEEQVRHVLWQVVDRHGVLRGGGVGGASSAALIVAARRALGRARRDGPLSHTLIRGLLVLSAFEPGGAARGVSEVADELEMKDSTAHRMLHTLAAVSLLQRDDATRRYRRSGVFS